MNTLLSNKRGSTSLRDSTTTQADEKFSDQYGKGMKHVSSSAISEFTTQEIHTFMCTNDFVDERIEIDIKDQQGG